MAIFVKCNSDSSVAAGMKFHMRVLGSHQIWTVDSCALKAEPVIMERFEDIEALQLARQLNRMVNERKVLREKGGEKAITFQMGQTHS